MKKLQMTGLALILLFLSLSAAAQGTKPEQMVVALSSPGKPYTLKISLTFGSIKVSGYTGKDIIIDAGLTEKNKTAGTEDAGNGMKRIFPAGGFDITAKEEDNVVTVSSNHNKNVTLVVKIPPGVKLNLRTVNNGVIEVDNVKGEIEANNVNGAIRLTNISGSAVASTVNGDVITNFTSLTADAAMAFTTLNGNVDITFPPTAKANLKLKSDRGEIFTDFDVAIQKSESKTIKTADDGMQRLKMDDWITGTINGGGAEVLMKNMNGNIYVRKVK